MPYEVLTWSLCDGWSNTWTEIDENNNEMPIIFDTKKEAMEEIKAEIDTTEDAIQRGDMDEDARLTKNDFKIIKAGSVKQRGRNETPIFIEIKDTGETVIASIPSNLNN